MYGALLQVIYAAFVAVALSAVRIAIYTFIVRILRQWFGLHLVFSVICASYSMSKILAYTTRFLFLQRVKRKKPEDKIVLNELSWISLTKTNEQQFEIDWQFLYDRDTKRIFSYIVDIPFHSGWLYFLSFIYIDYQIDNYNYQYALTVLRVLSVLIVLISGSAIRYQTLLNRERDHLKKLMDENPKDFERYIVYTNNQTPVASIGLQIHPVSGHRVFLVQLYQLNPKFEDYFYDLSNYVCQQMIERIKLDGNEREKSVHLAWSVPSCRKSWTYAMKANRFALRNTFKDFSFMPLVNSLVEQYEFIYEYKNSNQTKKDE